MEQTSSIYVAGHRGLVGSAIVRMLTARGFKNLITKPRSELDLRDRSAVDTFFRVHRPEYVFLAAARVGGILANSTYPVEFLLENLEIHTHILRAAHEHKTKKLLFLGSSCIYPKMASQPLGEDALLTGPLEPTNKPYAIAKIAGITLCQSYRKEFGDSFISVMPTNLYGPNDNFDLKTSHVLPAFIRKIYDAKKTGAPSVLLWGTGKPRREFLHVDDLADACLFLMEKYDDPEIVNVGTGEDLSIDELGQMVAEVIAYGGSILYDPAKPDGTPRKLLNVAKIHGLGWRHSIPLKEGIEMTYDWFINNYEKVAV